MTSSNSSDNSHKIIHHYLFKCWPDHGVPATPTSIHSFYEQIKIWLDLPPPVLIHCRSVYSHMIQYCMYSATHTQWRCRGHWCIDINNGWD